MYVGLHNIYYNFTYSTIFHFHISSNFETLPPIESTIRNSADGYTVQLKMQTAPTVWVPLTDDIFPVEFGADLSIFITHGKNLKMIHSIPLKICVSPESVIFHEQIRTPQVVSLPVVLFSTQSSSKF